MGVLDLYHLRCRVIKLLRELSLEQILEIRNKFIKLYPGEYPYYHSVFVTAISQKNEEIRLNEIANWIEKKKTAPSDAPTPDKASK